MQTVIKQPVVILLPKAFRKSSFVGSFSFSSLMILKECRVVDHKWNSERILYTSSNAEVEGISQHIQHRGHDVYLLCVLIVNLPAAHCPE